LLCFLSYSIAVPVFVTAGAASLSSSLLLLLLKTSIVLIVVVHTIVFVLNQTGESINKHNYLPAIY